VFTELYPGEIYRNSLNNIHIIIYGVDTTKVNCFHMDEDWNKDNIENVRYDYDNFVNNISSAHFRMVGKLNKEKLAKIMLLGKYE